MRCVLLLITLAAPLFAQAQFRLEPQRIVFNPQPGSFLLANRTHSTPLVLDAKDWPGVRRAAASFAGDLGSVTGQTPPVLDAVPASVPAIVLVGTLGHSALIDRLASSGRLDVSALRGHREMSVTEVVDHPFPGVERALVIAGSDKRGTIFGLYALSEQMGVSPWSWWADVPVQHHEAVLVTSTRFVAPEPRVRYRGIFLNDEAPALTGWTQEKFGGYNHAFYEHVFQLLLRLRANYLWPAMWNSAFNEDDPADPVLADEYGIVMGTSHHEPMLRAQQEWKRHGTGPWDYNTNSAVLQDFWTRGIERNKALESTITLGMRGDGDLAMSPTANTALLERIVKDQREIIGRFAPGTTDPQVWALYKEVQQYYEKGMRVPDDVTLLWCDDNWGNIRRLPSAEERRRPGGAGIYYHVDYVGDPRNYKWLLTYNISKISEQMHLAADYGADRIWILNVGDLKPMEFPISFFLALARDPDAIGPGDLQAWTRHWAAQQFGPEHAAEIARLIDTYTRYNARRKPEQLDPATYRITPGGEADRIAQQWKELATDAERLNAQLPAEQRAAFFELVLFPIEACSNLGQMYLAAGRNHLYAKEGRASANFWAAETRRLFAHDAELADQYNHTLLDGKWNHMMDQTHIGYTNWQQPPTNVMPAVSEVQVPPGAHLGVFAEGSDDPAESLPAFDSSNRQVRTLDLAPLGQQAVPYSIATSAPWIMSSTPGGTASVDTPVRISIDWEKAPAGSSQGFVTVTSPGSAPARIRVTALRVQQPHGYVEDAGIVTIDAEHTTSRSSANGVSWQVLPGFGLTRSGMEAFPDTSPSTPPPGVQSCLRYEFTTLTSGPRALKTILAPTLPFSADARLRFSVGLDGAPQQVVNVWEPYNDKTWSKAVSDGVQKRTLPLGDLAAGAHTLNVCRVDPGVVLERLLIFQGPAPAEYLGPVESSFAAP